jgi:hypothetical protein
MGAHGAEACGCVRVRASQAHGAVDPKQPLEILQRIGVAARIERD